MRLTRARRIRRQRNSSPAVYSPKGLAWVMAAAFMASPLTAGAAPAVPTPGEEIPQQTEQGKADIENSLSQTAEKTAVGTKFTLSNIRTEHEGIELSEQEIAAITTPLLNHEITAAELSRAVDELTQYARRSGYPAALAYIPEQTAKDGNLLIRFEPGRFDTVRVENNGVLKERIAHRPLVRLKQGQIIKAADLEESLRNLRGIPGINANAVLSPGGEQGTSNLTVKILPRDSNTYVLYTENYGSRAAGRYRYGLQADWKNLGGTGSRLNVGALISNGKQHGGNIAYEIPVGHSMTTLGIAYSHSDYELGSIWSQFGMEGKSDTVSIYGRTPLMNRYVNTMNLVYAYNYRKLSDEFNGMDLGDRHTYSFSIGVEGTARSSQNVVNYNTTFHAGTVTPDSAFADVLATWRDNKGGFTKGTFDITAVQQLGGPFDAMLKLSGQLAGHKLDSSEHIYLGGARGVRAYPQGEASGDEGLLGTLELRYHTKLPGLTLSLYYDAGTVRVEKNGNDSQQLSGWGVGVTYNKPNDWFARLDYARRIGFDEGLSDDANSRQRVWFMLGKIF